ncbi:DUF4416 family protein [bacterium]|nr:DUF4416 family protein [bacterium]
MAKPFFPDPVKLFVGLIVFEPEKNLSSVLPRLSSEFGEIERLSSVIPFDFTDYYEQEMGAPLWRLWVSFKNLFDYGRLADAKLFTNSVEECLSVGGSRVVNIDPGVLTLLNVVLASAKFAPQRVYLGSGIHAEIELMYHRGRFEPLPWTYPDYRCDVALSFFKELRAVYVSQLMGARDRR